MKRCSSSLAAVVGSQVTQRATWKRLGRIRALTPYSCSSRCATTSNCSWPTAPSSSTEPADRAEHLDRAFLAELRQAARSCLVRSGSATSTERNISGAKNGRPVNCSASPSVSVSPSCSTPWFGMPMMSPA